MMNSLNTEAASSLNPTKYRSIDVSNPYYQQNLFYNIPNNANINPEFTSLHNTYGVNQLLATQFSFQYSDNQGLGEGVTGGSHSGSWTGNVAQTRNNPSIDTSHFYSVPSHGHAQTADQNLFYPYGYSTTNNVYWPHAASVLEYKSANQNFALPPPTEKPPTWPDTLVNHQYSPLNYKSNVTPVDQNSQILSINQNHSNYDVQLASNGYKIAQVAEKNLTENMSSSYEGRPPHRKTDSGSNHETVYTSPTDLRQDIEALQSQMAKNCSVHSDNTNTSISQHPYLTQSLSKYNINNNSDAISDYWSNDANNPPSPNATKSYAKAAKLSSRSITHLPSSSSTSYYLDNAFIGNTPRSNYKSTTNGFATGFLRPSCGSSNWFNSTSLNGPTWNTARPKWNPDGGVGPACQTTDSSSKSTWVDKSAVSTTSEQLRNTEYRIKEIQLQINPKRLDINFEKTRYFVIKSYSEDDVHRSIKYKIWCSTKEGNRRLNEAFQGAQKSGGHILLFFSVNGSGHFCGVAEMVSPVDEGVVTRVWCQDKWRGKFSVKWLYVKDVPNTQLRHISTKVKIQKGNGETMNEVKPITNLRDATELKSERGSGMSYKDDIGYQALKIIMDCKSTMSIFDDFLHYEKREMEIEMTN